MSNWTFAKLSILLLPTFVLYTNPIPVKAAWPPGVIVKEAKCAGPNTLAISNVTIEPTTHGAWFTCTTYACLADGSTTEVKASEWVYVDKTANPTRTTNNYETNFGKAQLSGPLHKVRATSELFYEPNTTYYYRIYSKDTNRREALTDMGSFTTLPAEKTVTGSDNPSDTPADNPEPASGAPDGNRVDEATANDTTDVYTTVDIQFWKNGTIIKYLVIAAFVFIILLLLMVLLIKFATTRKVILLILLVFFLYIFAQLFPFFGLLFFR